MITKTLVARSLMAATLAAALHAAAPAQEPVVPAGPETAPPADAPAQAAPANPQVSLFVDQQFPAADADANGTLVAAEFTAWISRLKAAEMEQAGQAADPAAVKAYADGALAKADADKDQIITKPELVAFFGG